MRRQQVDVMPVAHVGIYDSRCNPYIGPRTKRQQVGIRPVAHAGRVKREKDNKKLLIQIRKLKHDNKYLQEELDHKRSIVDKETITNSIKNSLDAQIKTPKKGTNTQVIELLSTHKSLEA